MKASHSNIHSEGRHRATSVLAVWLWAVHHAVEGTAKDLGEDGAVLEPCPDADERGVDGVVLAPLKLVEVRNHRVAVQVSEAE